MKHTKTRTLTMTALFAAIATLLMYVEIPMPFMPPFLKFDLSSVPILIGSFMFGPVQAVFMAAIKALIHALSTQSGGVGELADFLITSSFAVSAGLVYRFNRTKRGAILSCGVGVVTITVVGALANKFILIPFYAKLMPIDAIVAACNAVNPMIDSINAYILFGAVPFNLIKGVLVSVITFALYKRLARILDVHGPLSGGRLDKKAV